MTQQDKELLLKDLCGRLPYNVKCNINKHRYGYHCSGDYNLELIEPNKLEEPFRTGNYYGAVWLSHEEIKPYLFPLSSMTNEEKEEYCQLQQKIIYNSKGLVTDDVMEYINWCYKHHLDINGLIPKDLAIDATKLDIY